MGRSMFDFLWLKIKRNRATILIVDDEVNIVQTLQDRLEVNGYRVVTACDGKEGLQKALAEKPDIILLDIIMPIMDGHEMLEHLRKTEEVKDTSVIILSARNQTQDLGRANANGIDDYIVKPFDLNELLEKLEQVLENKCVVNS
jgi:two-component system, OmpR family, alkaline phosphatase synthesis response regulator PhoP